jgi:hypothetical protein
MAIKFEFDKTSNIILINVSKKLSIEDLKKAQIKCEAAIKAVGNIKILVTLCDFQGWEKAEGWEDMSFSENNDSFIDKIAIIGNKGEWENLAYAFTAKGLRDVLIEFFEPTDILTAKKWLVNNSQ